MVATYQTIADNLRRRIEAGEFTDRKLPGERTLADAYGVSRATVRAAYDALVAEGTIVARQGIGYLVRDQTPIRWIASEPERNLDTAISPADAWSRNIREQGHTPSEEITVEIAVADTYVAERLAVEPDTKVVIRRRLRLVDGEPFMIADSYYLAADVEGTAVAEPGDVLPGVHSIFAAAGRPWSVQKVDRIRARMPRRDEIAKLNISPGTPVMTVGRVSSDVRGKPVRLTMFIVPGDRSESEYRLTENEE